MEEKLLIGEILKPQGILGEVKIKPYTDDNRRFLKLREVFVGETLYKVLGARVGGDFVFLAFSGVADRNAAELLRGKMLYVERENAVPLKKGVYFIVDVVGCNIVDEEGTVYGTVTEITQAARDIYTAKSPEGKIFRFPFLKDLVSEVDVENRTVTVRKKRLQEVVCYED